MSDSTALDQIEASTPPVLFLEITLPLEGKALRINKLKAKAHYEAQKIFAEWVRELQKIIQVGTVNPSKISSEDGNVDVTKFDNEYKDADSKRVEAVLEKSDEISKKRLTLISLCLGTSLDKLEEDYYPEDLDYILSKCLELNKFMDNLKKSVAPTAGIGV